MEGQKNEMDPEQEKFRELINTIYPSNPRYILVVFEEGQDDGKTKMTTSIDAKNRDVMEAVKILSEQSLKAVKDKMEEIGYEIEVQEQGWFSRLLGKLF